ncbi:MAG TPA: zinc-dependent alcohol dehydrogenase [Candidatus Acidoferrales bacterium]|nr:zinc-dependent alcohol dehydrogenase [Candidatus Acidoferrales bacterium]
MKAAVIEKWGDPLVIRDVAKPVPKNDEILVRVSATGVCHSDVHQWKGEWPDDKRVMEANGVNIIGHEGVGIIEEVGSSVLRFRPGERVGIPWMNYWCGGCEPCLTGYPHYCTNLRITSEHVNGTYAEYTTISERATVIIPDKIPDIDAAPLLCAGLTAYGAVRKLVTELRIPPGKLIAIVGAAGGLGHYAVQIAKAFGYKVLGVDVGQKRLEFVQKIGADYLAEINTAEQLSKSLGGAYAALVFTPNINGYSLSTRLIRSLGGLVVVGLPKPTEGPLNFTPIDIVSMGFRIIASSVGVSHELLELLDLYLAGKVKTEVSRTGRLSDINTVFHELIESKHVARTVLTI